MTKLREIALQRFKQALTECIPHIPLSDDALELALLPIWAEAVHDIFTEMRACPCVGEHEEECFAEKSPQQQRNMFSTDNELGFDHFLRTFLEGRSSAMLGLAQAQTGTH